jgi:deoxyribodipyrimidine photo-lyase
MELEKAPVIMWFRRDLRLSDNRALTAAIATGRPVIALYVLDDVSPGIHAMGGAQRWWLEGSIRALTTDLARINIELILRKGRAEELLGSLIGEAGAHAIFFSKNYAPWAKTLESRVSQMAQKLEIGCHRFTGQLLFKPIDIKTAMGQPYKVYTPFSRSCFAAPAPPAPLHKPKQILPFSQALTSDELDTWKLRPERPDWANGLETTWQPGEATARNKLDIFLAQRLEAYAHARDYPGIIGTSQLSPHLHFGEISPAQCWHAVRHVTEKRSCGDLAADKFLKELLWREFCAHLLHHWPNLPNKPFKPAFNNFPWRENPQGFERWCQGKTGYPIVDAGMRELWHTGWMHNRVRMIAASFLVKDLLIDWRKGAAWFQDTLVDADLASNSAGWQWVAGCGADAAPFFRIFNPQLQGEKFDPDGTYVRHWVPELANLPNALIHRPWAAPVDTLRSTKIMLGETYPLPIIDHQSARHQALDALKTIRESH